MLLLFCRALAHASPKPTRAREGGREGGIIVCPWAWARSRMDAMSKASPEGGREGGREGGMSNAQS